MDPRTAEPPANPTTANPKPRPAIEAPITTVMMVPFSIGTFQALFVTDAQPGLKA